MPRFLQPKLKLSRPASPAEAEADRAADRAVDEPQQEAQSASAFSTRDRTPVRAGGFASPGTGQALPRGVQRSMESRFDADFSGVRVHQDAGADAATSVMNARAFTVGGDVVFAAGEYQPGTPGGRRLLAHELSHVVQQSGGSQAGEGAPALSAVGPSVQRAVRTMGGEWDTTKYAVNAATNGVDINLVFTPEDPVDAELIGMSQTHRGVYNGSPWFPHGTAKGRSTPTGEKGVDSGAQIDQLAPYANPLYTTGATSPGDTLATTPTPKPTDWGVHGWHYTDAMGAPQHQNALLIDKPWIGTGGKNSSQTFESTALAVKGNQEGTYYGSVTWGWQTDATGALSVIPLALGSVGVPSATYMRSAELWNAGTTSSGGATIDLPTSKLPSSATLPSSRSTSDLVIQVAKVNAELATMVPGTDKTNKEFEKKALEFALAKRADQPTIPLVDQEKAAALLTTPDLIKRADVLPAEISGMAASPARTDKELEREAVKREVAKRKILITVHVHETEDIIGSDSVYVTASSVSGRKGTDVVDLNDGNEHTFVVPLSALFAGPPLTPASSSLFIKAYDEDWEGDDLMFDKAWVWSALPAEETQSRDGGKYTVRIDFAQLR